MKIKIYVKLLFNLNKKIENYMNFYLKFPYKRSSESFDQGRIKIKILVTKKSEIQKQLILINISHLKKNTFMPYICSIIDAEEFEVNKEVQSEINAKAKAYELKSREIPHSSSESLDAIKQVLSDKKNPIACEYCGDLDNKTGEMAYDNKKYYQLITKPGRPYLIKINVRLFCE
ncbi:hypothetical protein BpHYR1_047173 [Brachionus plicatilis]|uniref:Uncharacterized protein n=1 Tax=Brachionus plicatilis TaxID=10195 RepID=A0A3M7S274_BRAPC|nr:hypothetical protein BpHYR1_047173 [Brachionus plicatilis]